MRRLKCTEPQKAKASTASRLRQLERENGFLKLLYTDLLVKTAALKDGLARGVRVC